ncbi:oligosaccharide flippase family protein, partial [Sulfurovum sp. bin170]|uniref:oligosaccharide flippase family protein n=1 Tax=Sulfurovum sp. bin170 TaxID=2695268 RepID=UPI0013DE7C7E
MSRLIDKLKQNSYIFQIATLMSGTLMAQALMFAFIPILTRIYTPTEFGLYSLFFLISSMIGEVSSLRYEQAIMLPKSDIDAQTLVFLSVAVTFIITTIVTLVIVLFYDLFLNYFNGLVYLVWLLPPSILILGLTQIFDTYSTRRQLYKKIATVRVVESVTTIGTQWSSRYLFALDGLIVGKLISNFFVLYQFLHFHIKETLQNSLEAEALAPNNTRLKPSVPLHFHIKKQTLGVRYLTKRRLKANIKRHDSFPKYFTFSSLLNSFSQNIPIFLFSMLFSPAIAGFYGLTARVMQVPILLISGSTRRVFYQKASQMYANGENIREIYLKTTIGLIKLFILPLFIILLFGEEIFVLIFSNKWAESGVIAQITIIWFMFAF